MRRNIYQLAVVVLVIVGLLAVPVFGGQDTAVSRPPPFARLEDLDGMRVGIMVGTIFDAAVERHLDYVRMEYYDNYQVMEDALKAGEIDALMGDQVILRQIAADDPLLRTLEGTIPSQSYGFGFNYEDKELYGRFNAALTRLLNAGYVDFLVEKWVDGPPECKTIQDDPQRETTQVLRMGTCSVSPPFTYAGPDGRIIGLDIELAGKIAQLMNRRLVVVDMEFGELIPALVEGRVDVIGACMSITPDRLQVINFTDGYFRTGIGAMVVADPPQVVRLTTTEDDADN